MTRFIVTIKLDRNPTHNPRRKVTGLCPIGAEMCTDLTGEHHSLLVEAPDAGSAADRVRDARPGTWITRVEAARELERLSMFAPSDVRPYGYVPLAGTAWCENLGPRIGEDSSACTLPTGHAPNLAREIGTSGCRYTLGNEVVQDDAITSPVMWAPRSVAPGPAVRAVRVLAERRWTPETISGKAWVRVDDPQRVYRRYAHKPTAWWAEWRDANGNVEAHHSVGSWEELSETCVLVDVTERGRG